MDALMAALVAALLTQATDKTCWLAAKLGTRFERPVTILVAITIALAIVNAAAAFSATLIAPVLSPNAKSLLLAFALISAGASSLFALKPPKLSDARAGAFVASLAGALALGLGDRSQFITFALAARTPLPALAAIGATIGGLAVIVPSVLAGEPGRAALPFTPIRITVAILLLLAGAISGLSALRLI
jgi:putative Ca2+/H+ antiporter (TMEM165/GDT1 family)